MKKLSEKWRMYELFCQENFNDMVLGHGDRAKRNFSNFFVEQAENILDKKISLKDFEKTRPYEESKDHKLLGEELKKFAHQYAYEVFFKKQLYSRKYVFILGPIGKTLLYSKAYMLDLNDVVEVYVDRDNWSGCINSKTCGWIAWKVLRKDTLIEQNPHRFTFLISKNNINMEASIDDLRKKIIRYDREKISRHLKRIYADHFWFDDDLLDLIDKLPIVRYDLWPSDWNDYNKLVMGLTYDDDTYQ